MTSTAPAPDRRAADKTRRRRAILDAARALITERGRPDFSVDELAERADVSRRTVFNYFDSLDDIVLTTASDIIEVVIDDFFAASAATPVGGGTRTEMFDEIAQMLRATDLSVTVRGMCQVFGDDGSGNLKDPRHKQLILQTFSRVSEHLAGELRRRNPAADPLDVELLVVSLLHGVGVIAQHWIATTDLTGPDAHAAWDLLIDRLIDSVRAGYMPEH